MEKYINGELSEESKVKAKDFENRKIYYGAEER